MSTIFISGSRVIEAFPEEAITRIDNMMEAGHSIVVGDSDKGVDAAALSHLRQKGYKNVSVYTIHTKPRIKLLLDDWDIVRIEPETEKKISSTGEIKNSRDLETEKDFAMARVSDFGLVVWQETYANRFGKKSASKGSLRNMYQMLVEGKLVVLYRADMANSKDFEIFNLKNLDDLNGVVESSDELIQRSFNQILKKHHTQNALF